MSLRVEGARKTFRSRRGGEVMALDGVEIEARGGELLVIVGPSGSGKSTLLRAVAGLETLDSGRVHIDGDDVTQVPAGRRGVAMVFQEAALFPHMGVAANIGIGERARGASRTAVESTVREVARLLHIDHLLDRMPAELSGGERQRVALARVMVRAPRVCLLDEPLAAVDAELRLRMRAEIRAVQRSLAVPMVHVTHDQVEAMAMGDRVAVMDQGQVLQCDTPAEVYARPATTAVARSLGPLPMNLLPLQGEVLLGVRPERVRVRPAAQGRPAALRSRGGAVASVEPAGEDCVVRVLVDDLSAELLARMPWADAPRIGDRVCLTWQSDDEHHFDARTGRRR
jgi:ABC-type sugar transport system ATPase subunit